VCPVVSVEDPDSALVRSVISDPAAVAQDSAAAGWAARAGRFWGWIRDRIGNSWIGDGAANQHYVL